MSLQTIFAVLYIRCGDEGSARLIQCGGEVIARLHRKRGASSNANGGRNPDDIVNNGTVVWAGHARAARPYALQPGQLGQRAAVRVVHVVATRGRKRVRVLFARPNPAPRALTGIRTVVAHTVRAATNP